MANFAGTAGPDDFTGTPEADLMQGEAGDDILRGRDGDDFLHGGTGSDELRGGLGNDLVAGEDGDDYLYGGRGNDVLCGRVRRRRAARRQRRRRVERRLRRRLGLWRRRQRRLLLLDGDDVLLGGAGNDDITIARPITSQSTISGSTAGKGTTGSISRIQSRGLIEIAAGSGSDRIEINLLIDHLTIFFDPDGTDTVVLNPVMAAFHRDTTITLEGFGRGDEGGVIVWDDFLGSALTGWNGSANPFGSAGFARIHTTGGRQILEIDADGGGNELGLGDGSGPGHRNGLHRP